MTEENFNKERVSAYPGAVREVDPGCVAPINGPAGADWRETQGSFTAAGAQQQNVPREDEFTSMAPAHIDSPGEAFAKNAETVEETINRVGATKGPRITPYDIDSQITGEYYFTAGEGAHGHNAIVSFPTDHPLSLLTICVLVMCNGFTVVGTAACASPENYNAEVGRKVARADAVRQIWPLMGYNLRSEMRKIWLSQSDPS